MAILKWCGIAVVSIALLVVSIWGVRKLIDSFLPKGSVADSKTNSVGEGTRLTNSKDFLKSIAKRVFDASGYSTDSAVWSEIAAFPVPDMKYLNNYYNTNYFGKGGSLVASASPTFRKVVENASTNFALGEMSETEKKIILARLNQAGIVQ